MHRRMATSTAQHHLSEPVDLSLRCRKRNNKKHASKNFIPARNSIKAGSMSVEDMDQTDRPATHVPSAPDEAISRQATYICGYCLFQTNTTHSIEAHVKEMHFCPAPPQNQKVASPTQAPEIPQNRCAELRTEFTCNHCRFKTASEHCIVRHLLTVHRSDLLPMKATRIQDGIPIFSCSNCPFTSSETVMVNHIIEHYQHIPPCKQCSYCLDWNGTFNSLKSESLTPQNQVDVNLEENSIQTVPEELTSILARQDSLANNQHNCMFCDTGFPNSDELQAHTQIHMTVSNTFPVLSNLLKRPSKNNLEIVRHECDFCDEAFSTLNELEDHLQMHLQIHDQPGLAIGSGSSQSIDAFTSTVPTNPLSDHSISFGNVNVIDYSHDLLRANTPTGLLTPPSSDSERQPSTDFPTCSEASLSSSAVSGTTPNNDEHLLLPEQDDYEELNNNERYDNNGNIEIGSIISSEETGDKYLAEHSFHLEVDQAANAKMPKAHRSRCSKKQSLAAKKSKRRILALKIFKNTSGQYESKRYGSPEITQKEKNDAEMVRPSLMVRIPLKFLPRRLEYQMKENCDSIDADNEKGLPTDVSVELDQLASHLSAPVEESHTPVTSHLPEHNPSTNIDSSNRLEDITEVETNTPSKIMADLLKRKLSSIALKSKPALNDPYLFTDDDDFLSLRNTDTACSKPVSAADVAMQSADDDFIDLTLNDSSDESVAEREDSADTHVAVLKTPDPPTVSCDDQSNNEMQPAMTATVSEPPSSSGVEKAKQKQIRRYSQLRRRHGVSAHEKSVDAESSFDEYEMVVCPFCPKVLVYRLLPAHTLFHGSDCKYKCSDCDFASSFKWALDEHISCHKEDQSGTARKITVDQWMKIQSEIPTDDDFEMAQKLIVKQSVKRQSSKKTAKSGDTSVSCKKLGGTETDWFFRKVDKSRAVPIEDFFAKILTSRFKPRK